MGERVKGSLVFKMQSSDTYVDSEDDDSAEDEEYADDKEENTSSKVKATSSLKVFFCSYNWIILIVFAIRYITKMRRTMVSMSPIGSIPWL